MSFYLYKLIPPRPGFATDMTPDERAIMNDHVAYWTRQRDTGTAVAFGPVADPAGSWGVGIIEAENDQAAEHVRASDPAAIAGIATVEIYPMRAAVVRPHRPMAEGRAEPDHPSL